MSNELEQARKAAIINRVIKYVVCLGIPALIIGNMIADAGKFTGKTLLGCIIGFSIIYFVVSAFWGILAKNRAYAKFISLYKKEMIESALNGGELYENMEFDHESGINPDLINGTGMITACKLFTDCYLSGTYNGVSFIQADVRNLGRTGNGYALEYDGTLMAIPTTLPDAKQTNIYHKDADCGIILPGAEIKTGNSVFDAMFKVSTSDEGKAKALLTSDFTSKLVAIQNQMTSNLVMTVRDGWMYVLLPNKKSVLKPNLFAKYDDSMKNDILKELSRAKLFIDAFSK